MLYANVLVATAKLKDCTQMNVRKSDRLFQNCFKICSNSLYRKAININWIFTRPRVELAILSFTPSSVLYNDI